MEFIFRGVRGSIAVPGADTIKYGGNTTCIQIRTENGDNIILDGGTGVRLAGMDLMKQLPVTCSIFITHTHWDHIQGLPFFIPFFVPGNQIDIYGAFDPIYNKSLKAILSQQMEYCYFPLRENDLKATINYNDIRELQQVQVGTAKVTSFLLNHPVLNYGYKIEADGKTLFFTGDHEPQPNFYEPGEEGYDEFQSDIEEKEEHIIDFIKDVDVFICDSQYTDEEYPEKQGWGHGSYSRAIDMAKKAHVGSLYLTHHEPVRSDKELDDIYAGLLADKDLKGDFDINMAIEGKLIQV